MISSIERDNHTQEPPVTTVQEPEVTTAQEPPVNAGSELSKAAIVTGANQAKPTGKPTRELVETWLRLSEDGLGGASIEKIPESEGFKQTTIKKYLRLAREAKVKGRSWENAHTQDLP